MAVDIGPKIGITGEREFRNQLQQTNQALKTLEAESKAVTSAFDDETDAEKKSAAQKDVLNRQIETQKDKLALLEKGLQEATQKFGEADTRTMKWQQAVHEGTAKLNDMERQLNGMDAAIDENTDSMEEAAEATSGWADVMKGQLLADAVKTGLEKVLDLTKKIGSAMWDASKAGAAYADDILTLAVTTGLSTDELQEYKYMANLVDVSLDTLTGSLTKLTSNMGKAKDGEGDAAAVFKELKVSVTDSNGQLRKAKDVFRDTITALGKVKNETERDTKAMTLFGKSAKELNPMIAAGADEMESLAKEAHKTGYVLSGEALTALGKQQDAMERLDRRTEALKNNFAAKLAPSLEKVYSGLEKTFDNPYVKRGMDEISEGFGRMLENGESLVGKVLPGVMKYVGSLFEERLWVYTEAQLELSNATKEITNTYNEMADTYQSRAKDIVSETERERDLWKELQKITDENGYVTDANKGRAEFIVSELNAALGKEYEINDNIITQYQEMQKEIDTLILKRETEALLAASADAYAVAKANSKEALDNSAQYAKEVADTFWEMYKLQNEYGALWIGSLKSGEYRGRFMDLIEDWGAARKAATGYYDTIDRYEKASQAMLHEDYALAEKYLANDYGLRLEYYTEKKELNEKERKDLQDMLNQANLSITEYKALIKQGLVPEEGLKDLEDYRDKILQILDGKYVADQWINGMVLGLTDKQNRARVAAAAAAVAELVPKASRRTMEIKSPSRVGKWIGEMWDEGLIKGLEAREAKLAAAAASLADTITASSIPMTTRYDNGYGNAMTAVGSASYNSSTSSYTTNMGGITVRVDGAGAVNEDVLAQRVAVRLTNELQRAQRGGRR